MITSESAEFRIAPFPKKPLPNPIETFSERFRRAKNATLVVSSLQQVPDHVASYLHLRELGHQLPIDREAAMLPIEWDQRSDLAISTRFPGTRVPVAIVRALGAVAETGRLMMNARTFGLDRLAENTIVLLPAESILSVAMKRQGDSEFAESPRLPEDVRLIRYGAKGKQTVLVLVIEDL